ncbi:MAG: hypothetical protein LC118_18630 [Dehalococcoidia bacterium]|nr:hypothetical protein [Dehalococcoidia bacterium]
MSDEAAKTVISPESGAAVGVAVGADVAEVPAVAACDGDDCAAVAVGVGCASSSPQATVSAARPMASTASSASRRHASEAGPLFPVRGDLGFMRSLL